MDKNKYSIRVVDPDNYVFSIQEKHNWQFIWKSMKLKLNWHQLQWNIFDNLIEYYEWLKNWEIKENIQSEEKEENNNEIEDETTEKKSFFQKFKQFFINNLIIFVWFIFIISIYVVMLTFTTDKNEMIMKLSENWKNVYIIEIKQVENLYLDEFSTKKDLAINNKNEMTKE